MPGGVFSRISVVGFRTCFSEWIAEVFGAELGSHIAIDGKRQCATSRKNESPLTILSAFASEAGICLGQYSVEEKSNEITGIPKLLDGIDISGSVVTIDAIGCQTEIASKILEQGADYLIAVKGNQPSLHQDVMETFSHFRDSFSLSEDIHECEDMGHGRKEKRVCRVIKEISWLPEADQWPSLSAIVKVESYREIKGKKSDEERFYISSQSDTAESLGRKIRSHWAIENNLHWILDVAYQEDNIGIRDKVAAENLGLVRKITHAIMRRDKSPDISFKRLRKRYSRRPDLLFKSLSCQMI